jgi:hypothetical protein
MTARTSSINGVTRPREFNIELSWFKRHGSTMRASAEASTIGLKPGEWPDWFTMPVIGTFTLRQVDDQGTHIYSDDNGSNWLTIFND